MLDVASRRIAVSSPGKVFFSGRAETQLDLVRYYLAVVEPLIRAVGGRPTSCSVSLTAWKAASERRGGRRGARHAPTHPANGRVRHAQNDRASPRRQALPFCCHAARGVAPSDDESPSFRGLS
jgi:hypothetical protein